MSDKNSKFAIFRGIEHGNVFWSTNNPSADQTKLTDGRVAYEVLDYADTQEEAITKWKEHYNNPSFGELMRLNMKNILDGLK